MKQDSEKCLYLKKTWVDDENNQQVYVETCTNPDCGFNMCEYLDTSMCIEGCCYFFEKRS